ncbi:MAG: NAD(P)H-dependent oxidoreductase [Candidatus Marinimicrobia bacterium]|jgi:NAD(P)H-dependent FMN reductase|nr:NAD(P)H-dependent oxidoreductase [Candidatus Neomarinimicrobiota bacterium]MBT3501471.1 NAD(P)H-dependent oxidoreductase [Candidatus Neomarinimicrobiota bacterium]MBT3839390.1 NAD(P)H-dependent oxidoreductase [Candidatus Neomarinimicrobiota bacterium]MBT3998895.1 NAD(P)H-dependent oxidoreductase [Candidatus Neomarinimicrobiota bacterium]MBT4283097.1 NAD(P)H-dependent oxidoreductase [Candidatus Neomarinimicrobiota bacterium]
MKLLIVSATKGNNHILAEKIAELLNVDYEIISLEDYSLPLFVPGGEKADEGITLDLVSKFENADGFVFCIPEYNAGMPPILTNAITWITVSTKNWRGAFSDKKALIATHSGGPAFNLLSTFQDQLEYMGCTVHHRKISVHGNAKFNMESVERILNSFVKLF